MHVVGRLLFKLTPHPKSKNKLLYKLLNYITYNIPIEQIAMFSTVEQMMTSPPIFAFPPAYISFGHFRPRSSF